MKKLSVFIILAIAALWLNNTSLFTRPTADIRLIAHRGVHQQYDGHTLTNETCTANPIKLPTHGFIENTIPSMQAAFNFGADVVELDIHLSTDGTLVVFHDWTLDCRTNGTGITNQTPYSVIKELDAAFGYTSDGKTYPLRGKGIGLVPTLTEIFKAFPGKQFLINIKSNRRDESDALVDLFNRHPEFKKQVFGVYGGVQPTRIALGRVESLKGYDKKSIRECLISYVGLGWSGHIPEACRETLIVVPLNYAPYLWGWPYRFQERMAKAGSTIILLGPNNSESFSTGIDDEKTLARIPSRFSGYIWTNKIESIGPASKRNPPHED